MKEIVLCESDGGKIAALLVGRKVVRAEMKNVSGAEGFLVLDDGTELYLAGNEGGCCCGSGDYPLVSVATVDNIITSAHVNAEPDGDDESGAGVYQIFVFADAKTINVAEFQGTDGNGYYGTGFSVRVVLKEATS